MEDLSCQMESLANKRIKEILEDEIINLYGKYEHCKFEEFDAYEYALHEMCELRRDLIIDSSQIETEQEKDMVREFNNCLREALTGLYNESQDILNRMEGVKGKVYVHPKLFIDEDYPLTMPDQSERAKKMWEVMLDRNVHIPYTDGYYLGNLEQNDSLNRFLYLDEKPNDWNFDIVGLFDVGIPDMVMVHATHDFASHMHFTIFELMHVRKFKTEINVEILSDENE